MMLEDDKTELRKVWHSKEGRMQVKVLNRTERGTKGNMYIFFRCLLIIAKKKLV